MIKPLSALAVLLLLAGCEGASDPSIDKKLKVTANVGSRYTYEFIDHISGERDTATVVLADAHATVADKSDLLLYVHEDDELWAGAFKYLDNGDVLWGLGAASEPNWIELATTSTVPVTRTVQDTLSTDPMLRYRVSSLTSERLGTENVVIGTRSHEAIRIKLSGSSQTFENGASTEISYSLGQIFFLPKLGTYFEHSMTYREGSKLDSFTVHLLSADIK
jgi:hypothetical protein